MRRLTLAALVCVGCVHVDVRDGKPDAVWSLSPRQMIETQDPSIRVCCPRGGGDLHVNAILRDDGRVVDVTVTPPPAGFASGLVCVPSVALVETINAIDPETRDERQEIIDSCADRKRALGGAWLFNAVPEASRRCFEKYFDSFAWGRGATVPVSLDLRCPAM